MAAHLFNESGQMQEVDIPDIFDVLEGGEDESAVKFLLGFNAEDAANESANEILNNNGLVQQVLTSNSPLSNVLNTNVVASSALSASTTSLTNKTIIEKTSPARVVGQIEPPSSGITVATPVNSASALAAASSDKTDKARKREPVDPSRCIYACDSCGKAFTTKFNLKRHINMHCSRSREAGVPIQGPPSASQPSRKNKSKDAIEPTVTAVATATAAASVTSGATQLKIRRVSSSTTPTVVNHATPISAVHSAPTIVKTVPVVTTPMSKTYQEPLTVQLAVNAQGQLTANRCPTVATTVTTTKPSLPVQPLPESAVQFIQSLSGGSTGGTTGTTQRIVRVINAPQIIATQSRAGITTGATVQLQAIPVTSTNGTTVTFPQQPLPLVQQIGTRQIVLTTSNNLTKMAAKVADIMPSIAATALESATKINITPVVTSTHSSVTSSVTSSNLVQLQQQQQQPPPISAADLIYRSIVSSKATSSEPSLTPLQAVVTSSTISSPTGFNDGPPAELFDSEDGDALSVATTTETPTPPPSLNGDPFLSNTAIKSMPGDKDLDKVLVLQQPLSSLTHSSSIEMDDHELEDDESSLPMTLPTNRFHGQLTSIPKGWLRKVVTTGKGFQKVFYYNPVGKRFSCQEEIDQYFARLGYSVPMSLFNFELPKLVDEDEDEDEDEDDLDEAATTTMNKTVVVKVTSNAKGEATVTPTTSTVVALPSGTIVTRADTTVDAVNQVPVSRTAQSSPSSLVTSTKPLLTSTATSTAKVLTLAKPTST